MKLFLTLAVLGVANLGLATDILWIKMNVNHTYKDSTVSCKSIKPGGEVLLSAEHEDGKLSRVVLSNFPYVFPYKFIYKSVELSSAEVARIETYKDPKGRFWLKKLPLPEHLIRWVLYWSAERYSYCPLPQLLQTVTPAPIDFEFETEGLAEGILISYSQNVSLSGLRSDGQPYQAKMEVVQREYKE